MLFVYDIYSAKLQLYANAWGGKGISGKGVHMFKGVGVRFAEFI